MRVLLVVRKRAVAEDVQSQLKLPDVELIGATSLEEVRTAFAESKVDVVIMGAGLDLETRLEIIRAVYSSSETTSIHLKDVASGPEGYLAFVRGTLAGERSREP